MPDQSCCPPDTAADLKARINAALDCLPTFPEAMAYHHLWVVRGVMDDIDPEVDLLAPELLALLAVLAPVHARVLARRAGVDVAGPLDSALSIVR